MVAPVLWPALSALPGMAAAAAPAAATAGRSLFGRVAAPAGYTALGGALSSMLGSSGEPTPTAPTAAPRPAAPAAPADSANPFAYRPDARGMTLAQLQGVRQLAPPRVPAGDILRLEGRNVLNQAFTQAMDQAKNLPERQRATEAQAITQRYMNMLATLIGSNPNVTNPAIAQLLQGAE